jgi:hypothetical protein
VPGDRIKGEYLAMMFIDTTIIPILQVKFGGWSNEELKKKKKYHFEDCACLRSPMHITTRLIRAALPMYVFEGPNVQ